MDGCSDSQTDSQTIVGIGSPHGPDQAGWIVVNRLRQRGHLQQNIQILATPIEILDHIKNCDSLVIVDACQSGATPGTVFRLQWPDSRIMTHRSCSSHGWSVGESLQLAEQLGRLPSSVVLYGLEISQDLRIDMTPQTISGLDLLEQLILEDISK